MISALTAYRLAGTKTSFSAIARSVMISAFSQIPSTQIPRCFSAIARSVMISAVMLSIGIILVRLRFSAIARSVMISAFLQDFGECWLVPFQCYSS